jgi:hypothetical protein
MATTRRMRAPEGLAGRASPDLAAETRVVIGLNAAIVAMSGETPEVLVIRHQDGPGQPGEGLPFGPFEPLSHRTMEIGLRRWVEAQTQLSLGYVEQLYTFADRGRHAAPDGEEPHVVSVGYLALTRHAPLPAGFGAEWRGWYRYFPWEDRRKAAPAMIPAVIEPLLRAWADAAPEEPLRALRRERTSLCFGQGGLGWNEEQALERYELLYEAGLVHEARRDRPDRHEGMAERLAHYGAPALGLGEPMLHDHRRILATAMGRLRGKLKYRPVVFELMPAAFTLLELQRTVEAVSGIRLHKQNFRRLLARTGLVEPTGRLTTKTGGRPAEQYCFRREVLRERPAPGVRMPAPRRGRG